MTRSLSLLALGLLGGLSAGAAQADDLVARGAYLATAGDCAACHTADGGPAFAGGKAIATPIGAIIASNITPSTSAGIGGWSEAEFARALRRGVSRDGHNLYPAMPYTAYAGLTDADVKALYAYFEKGVQPVDDPAPATHLPFPFSVRASMKIWNLLFLKTATFAPDPAQSEAWNRGAYLAQTLAHCATCHTPRNALMAEKGGEALAGASLGTWYAPNITSDSTHGIGGWSQEALEAYLSTGRSGTGSQAGGPMLEAIDKSLSKLDPKDIAALATYIRDVPARSGDAAPGQTGKVAAKDMDVALRTGAAPAGAVLYDQHCATCHGASGTGGHGLPALVGNRALQRPTADNAVMTVLEGVLPESGQAMPAFASKLDDGQVAQLVTYLQEGFGDAGVKVTPERVAQLRAGGAPSGLLKLAQVGLIAAAVVLVLLILAALLLWRRRA
ncbi:c-type cytochrome [Pseudooceanicola sp. GBMRC 2024]|uniref:C-type cytochrome n=1 Tax=Pseudooceanicola albus TaxID=2692189 RepID=A0A6L7G3A9_9RHOB|nr:cytochrome c [Pseudooceanicola albus]MXN17916.1 c-type cytochrome [Pseudooceanicola albus]